MAKRRTQWSDTVQSTVTAVAGIAQSDETLVTEDEFENVGGGATITRIVGELWIHASLAAPVTGWAIWLKSVYTGATSPDLWDNDTFQREAVMATGWYMSGGHTQERLQRYVIDVRTKRKVGQGRALLLSFQNYIASTTIQYTFHIRTLLLLP